MSRRATKSIGRRLVVDPISCAGVGLCAHLASDVVDLDRWGFPVLPRGELTQAQIGPALRAARGCPRAALQVLEGPLGRG